MYIRIAETGLLETLRFIDRKSGIDCAWDIVGNYSPKLEWDEEHNVVMYQDDFDWWNKFFDGCDAVEDRKEEVAPTPDERAELEEYIHTRFNWDADLEDTNGIIDELIDDWLMERDKQA